MRILFSFPDLILTLPAFAISLGLMAQPTVVNVGFADNDGRQKSLQAHQKYQPGGHRYAAIAPFYPLCWVIPEITEKAKGDLLKFLRGKLEL